MLVMNRCITAACAIIKFRQQLTYEDRKEHFITKDLKTNEKKSSVVYRIHL